MQPEQSIGRFLSSLAGIEGCRAARLESISFRGRSFERSDGDSAEPARAGMGSMEGSKLVCRKAK